MPVTPRSLDDRFLQVQKAVRVTFWKPGKDRRFRQTEITGQLLGEMRARGDLHHYRVKDDAGVVWFVPPGWLDNGSKWLAFGQCGGEDAAMRRAYNEDPELVMCLVRAAAALPQNRTYEQFCQALEKARSDLEARRSQEPRGARTVPERLELLSNIVSSLGLNSIQVAKHFKSAMVVS